MFVLNLQSEGEGLRAALEHAEERAPPPPAHSLKHELQHPQAVCVTVTVSNKLLLYSILTINT